MKLFSILLLLLLFAASPVQAGDCRDELREYISGPLQVVQGMADYKAAMDAGYAACMVSYPAEFAPLRTINDFMQANLQTEMEQARAVLNYMIAHPDAKKVSQKCVKAQKDKEALKQEVAAWLDGQYRKAYARRHRVMSKAGLVTEDQDSCLIVLDMVKKYDQHYDDFERLQFVLYESSKKQGSADRRAFRRFEEVRDSAGAGND